MRCSDLHSFAVRRVPADRFCVQVLSHNSMAAPRQTPASIESLGVVARQAQHELSKPARRRRQSLSDPQEAPPGRVPPNRLNAHICEIVSRAPKIVNRNGTRTSNYASRVSCRSPQLSPDGWETNGQTPLGIVTIFPHAFTGPCTEAHRQRPQSVTAKLLQGLKIRVSDPQNFTSDKWMENENVLQRYGFISIVTKPTKLNGARRGRCLLICKLQNV